MRSGLYVDMKACQQTIYKVIRYDPRNASLVARPRVLAALPAGAGSGRDVRMQGPSLRRGLDAVVERHSLLRAGHAAVVHALAKGGGWPSCAQGDASPVGYQPYAACPEGSAPIAVSQPNASGRGAIDTTTSYSQSASGGECGTPTPIQTGSSDGCNGAYVGGVSIIANERSGGEAIQAGGQCYALSARPANPTPYYVDITTANGASRFSFSLAGYGR